MKCSVGDDVLASQRTFSFNRTKHQSGEGTLYCEKHDLTPRCFIGNSPGVWAPRMQD